MLGTVQLVAPPLCGFFIVLRHVLAITVVILKSVLRLFMALFGGFAVPLRRFGMVLLFFVGTCLGIVFLRSPCRGAESTEDDAG